MKRCQSDTESTQNVQDGQPVQAGKRCRRRGCCWGKVLLLVGFVVLGGIALWRCGAGHCAMNPQEKRAFVERMVTWKVDDLLDKIGATDAQRKAVNEAKDRLLTEAFQLHDRLEAGHGTVLREWSKTTPDAKALHQLVDERIDALRGLAHRAVDEVVKIHPQLSPEQRRIVQERIEEHMVSH